MIGNEAYCVVSMNRDPDNCSRLYVSLIKQPRPCAQVRSSYGLDLDQALKAASAEPAGTEGVSFLPFFGGERTPNWPHATGTILGLRNGQLRPGLILRAAMEGITFLLADGLEELRGRGLAPRELRLVGGAARSALWRQIIADVVQLPVLLPIEAEAAALGAVLQVRGSWGGCKLW